MPRSSAVFRNLSFSLGGIKKLARKLVKTGGKLAPTAIKAALISQFGPAAAIALQGVDLAVVQPKAVAPKSRTPKVRERKVGTLQLSLESSPAHKTTSKSQGAGTSEKQSVGVNELLRRMTFAFRQAR